MDPSDPFRPDIAVTAIARQLEPPTEVDGRRSRTGADMGLLATLRRFHPVTHGHACLLEVTQVLEHAGVEDQLGGSDRALVDRRHQRWAVLVHCLAIARGAHKDGGRSPGEALASIGYGENRLRLLLQADEALLLELMPLLARRLAAARATVDWQPLARLLLNAGIDEAAADRARSWIARGYIQAGKQGAADPMAAAATATPDDTSTGSPT